MGAGNIGLLAAMLAGQRPLDVHVFDVVEYGPNRALVRALGATYHTSSLAEVGLAPGIILVCSRVPAVVSTR